MPVKKRKNPIKKKRATLLSADAVPQIEAVIIDPNRNVDPPHVLFLHRASDVLDRMLMVSCASVFALSLMIAAVASFASDDARLSNPGGVGKPLTEVGDVLGTSNALPVIIANILTTIFGLLGIVFVVLIIYGGFLWMTDPGDEKQLIHAKNVIKNSVIGLLVVVLAVSATNYIISILSTSL